MFEVGCSPSFENETSHIPTSPNKYNLLKEENISKIVAKEKQMKQRKKKMEKSKEKIVKPKAMKNQEINLLKNLTKIKSKEY